MTPSQRVAAWAHTVREATAERDAAMVAMRAEGYSLREIAAVAGLSHTTVATIVARTEKGQS